MEELYLKRKIDAFLSIWKQNNDRKPLIVKGPRQVGKTESIKKFASMFNSLSSKEDVNNTREEIRKRRYKRFDE